MARVLLLTGDAIGARMAGPAIRFLEVARALHAAGHRPTVATADLGPGAPETPFPIVGLDRARAREALGPLVAECDVAVLYVFAPFEYPFLARARVPLVLDLHDPVLLEALEQGAGEPMEARTAAQRRLSAIVASVLGRADFVICASERQRDLWLGGLLALGRLTPFGADEDPAFRTLIDVVPFGIPREAPRRDAAARPVLKGTRPGIAAEDRVLLWGGGIWNWLDPLTPIRALGRLVAAGRRDVHLVFFGGGRPAPGVPAMRMAAEARGLAESLGLAGRQVHFLEAWVPYEERARYLLESDAAVSCHADHAEARFAFRTRLLDCLWACVPIVCSTGDFFSDLVERERLGVAVGPGDEAALATAIGRVLDDRPFAEECRRNLERVAPRFAWEEAARPLIRFCNAPRLAADRRPGARAAARGSLGWLARRGLDVLVERGPREALARAWRRLRLAGGR